MAAMIAATPACTLVAIGTVGSTIATHNAIADSSSQWGYETPLIIGAAVGLVVDIFLVIYIGGEWGQPLT